MVLSINKYKKYLHFKPSNIEWIGEIPAGWHTRRFRFIFSFNNGLNITKENLQDSGVPCVNYGEIHSKYGFEVIPGTHVLKCVDDKYLASSKKSLVNQGDFIFADTSEDIEGSGNFTYVNSNIPAFAGYHTIIARPIKSTNSRYLAYLFDSISFRTQIRSEVAGIKVYSITKKIIKDAIVLLPPLPEQQAIASFLDRETARINRIIEKQTRLIELLKEKRSALITQAVTRGLDPNAKMKDSGVEWIGEIPDEWEVRKLKFICRVQTGDKDTVDSMTEGIYPLFVRSQIVERIDVFTHDCEAVLTAGDGVGVGKVFHYYNGRFSFHQRVYLFSCFKNIIGKYLYYFLKENFYKVALEGRAKSTVDSLRMPLVLNFILSLPPLPEQQAIVDFIDRETVKIDTLISKIEKQIDLLNEYKQSLITAAVTGKIDVRNVQ
ncbi:MAG TPA: restriction endonuclease subunit S [Spirochaetota bacterium]|nr:restriction endonuclease subunit S [Spirochaetota bacterium]